eukprot:613643-Prorocentrum_minimum.AAC.1
MDPTVLFAQGGAPARPAGRGRGRGRRRQQPRKRRGGGYGQQRRTTQGAPQCPQMSSRRPPRTPEGGGRGSVMGSEGGEGGVTGSSAVQRKSRVLGF